MSKKKNKDGLAYSQYTYRFNYRGEFLPQLLELSKASKDLYNQAQYWVRQNFIFNGKMHWYKDVQQYMYDLPNLHGEINYRKLKAQTSQQILKLLEKDWKSFFNAIKDYSQSPEKYTGRPKLPGYKRSDVFNLIYTNQCCSIKNGMLKLAKDIAIKIPQPERIQGVLCQCRIIPKKGYCTIEIIYEQEDLILLDSSKYISVDMGVNSIMACVSSGAEAILYNGKHIKSYNKDFNKKLAKAQSLMPKIKTRLGKVQKKNSKLIRSLYTNRNNYMHDKMHKISASLIEYCFVNDIGTIVIGQNKGWKDESSMSKKTNQTFCQIPHAKLIDLITYKAKRLGIKVITHEESYTSKCDALAFEPICKHESYSGKRVHRGLFKSSGGQIINADINGALNILRKVVGDSVVRQIVGMGDWLTPYCVTL
nr:transposase [uncultured Flavobacterium sp.]